VDAQLSNGQIDVGAFACPTSLGQQVKEKEEKVERLFFLVEAVLNPCISFIFTQGSECI
jgi:hypothetical protein